MRFTVVRARSDSRGIFAAVDASGAGFRDDGGGEPRSRIAVERR